MEDRLNVFCTDCGGVTGYDDDGLCGKCHGDSTLPYTDGEARALAGITPADEEIRVESREGGVDVEVKFWVCYEVFGKRLRQGPYATRSEAEEHVQDIGGFEGVGGCWATSDPPAEYAPLGAQ